MANEKIEKVNEILLKGEPDNISVDEHADYTGYKPQSVVDAMNEVFWGEWGFVEIANEIVPNEKGGGLAIAKVEVWIKGNDFHPTGWGQNRVTRGDEGDARKGAQTDALKKALSYFGVGNRAYHGLLPNKKEQAATRQQTNNQRPSTPAARPAQPTSTEKPAQARPAYYIAFRTGKEKGLYDGIKGFCEFASKETGVQYTPETIGTIPQPRIDQIMAAITGKDPALGRQEAHA